ncbi:hypothetical protein SAY87_008151 [Trapa incisa]|uniref:Uncharacterized protein n=1 Tax=Trapa incisa TaxID=236973 RepID=A0AAN7KFK4_9MYRT|nr:hypothetical protein SAY87_008151 [Trapa incisa]
MVGFHFLEIPSLVGSFFRKPTRYVALAFYTLLLLLLLPLWPHFTSMVCSEAVIFYSFLGTVAESPRWLPCFYYFFCYTSVIIVHGQAINPPPAAFFGRGGSASLYFFI